MATVLSVGCAFMANAQKVGNVRLRIKSDYMEVSGVTRVFSEKIYISLQYGQKVDDFVVDTYIRDDDNKPIGFDSVLSCINKMKSYGYELFQVYTQPIEGRDGRIFYVLKRSSLL